MPIDGKSAGTSKGQSWQSRACPDDFEVIFVEKGRLECEAHYRARRTTVTRWLKERGKKRLLKRRAEFVAFQRSIKRGEALPANEVRVRKDRRKTDPKLVVIAARFLQSPRGGGWVSYKIDDGEWMIGTMRRTPSEVIDIAIKKGFDRRRALEQIRAFDEPI